MPGLLPAPGPRVRQGRASAPPSWPAGAPQLRMEWKGRAWPDLTRILPGEVAQSPSPCSLSPRSACLSWTLQPLGFSWEQRVRMQLGWAAVTCPQLLPPLPQQGGVWSGAALQHGLWSWGPTLRNSTPAPLSSPDAPARPSGLGPLASQQVGGGWVGAGSAMALAGLG